MSARIDTSTGFVASIVDCLRDEGCPNTAAILEALAAERDAALAREAKMRDALQAKTIMDPNNSNSTWIDAQARSALQDAAK
jgi:hypothetical protein